jgi:hypothetical protein
LQKINKNILENSSGIQNTKSNLDNTAISLNKDSLYETFSLFQQFLNSSKVENNNSNGKIDQKKIGEQIQEFLERKRETDKKIKNVNKKHCIEDKDKIKKERKNMRIKTKLVKSAENFNMFNNNNKDILMNQTHFKTNYNLNDKENNGKKTQKFFINKNLLLSNNQNSNIDNDSEMIFPNINKTENIAEQKRHIKIKKSKSTNNILENKENDIIKNIKVNFEKNEVKNNEIKIQKKNSFSNNMKEIIKNKFKKKRSINKGLDISSHRNKQNSKDKLNFHSNSCASFFNNTFFDNNLNISPYSLQKKNNNRKIPYNQNTLDNPYRNNVISKKKMIDSKSEKKWIIIIF